MQSPALRVGDEEREQVADALRRHAAAGRLDPEELEAPLDRAYAARIGADLAPLTADLPALDAPRKPPAPALHHDVRHAIAVALTVDLAAVAIWAASGAEGDFWPKWVFILTTLVVVRRLFAHGRSPEAQRKSDST
jgi:hypothetical protein